MPTRMLAPALAFILPLAVYLAAPARTMNGDGLAYYHMAKSPDWVRKCVPGHLIYVPVADLAGRAVQAIAPSVTLPQVMLGINQLAGAGAVCLLFLAARRLGLHPVACSLAAAGLAVSFGFWIQAADVEAYAPALLFLCAGLYCMAAYATAEPGRARLGWAVALGACNAAAGLFHLATVTFGLACVLLVAAVNGRDWRRTLGHGAAYLAAAAVVFGVPVVALGVGVVGVRDVSGLLAWLRSADHGYRAAFTWASPARGAYGFARTFIVLESFWEGPKWLIALKMLAVYSAIGGLLWAGRRSLGAVSRPAACVLGACLAFAVLQAALGVYYFGSDSERWVFIAPLVWVGMGVAAAGLTWRGRGLAFAGVAGLAAANFAVGIGPLAADGSAEARVAAFHEATGGDALVITPGHDWLSYYTLYRPEAEGRAEVVSLVNLALRRPDDADGVLADVGRRVEKAREAGRPVVLVRVLDPNEGAMEDPWQVMDGLGLPRTKVKAWAAGYEWDTFSLADPRKTLAWRLVGPAGFARLD